MSIISAKAMISAQTGVDPAILGQLACPACHGDLRIEAGRLVCVDCGRAYPVVDGIPVLIVEHAETAARS